MNLPVEAVALINVGLQQHIAIGLVQLTNQGWGKKQTHQSQAT